MMFFSLLKHVCNIVTLHYGTGWPRHDHVLINFVDFVERIKQTSYKILRDSPQYFIIDLLSDSNLKYSNAAIDNYPSPVRKPCKTRMSYIY